MKKSVFYRVSLLLFAALFAFTMVSCSSGKAQQSFAEAHDAFTTKLATQENDDSDVPGDSR